MKKNKADLGFTFDGDADRCITLNEKGEIVDGEVLLATLAIHFKVKHLVSTVVFNGGVEKYLLGKGINFTRTPVGCRHVITALKSLKVPAIGGEPNGHFMFPSVTEKAGILIDDGLVTALMITSMVVNSGKPLSRLCEGIPMWHFFNGEVRGREVKLSKDESDAMARGGIWVDGCRVLIRKSGTEDMTRIYVEGEDKSAVDKLAKKYME
jgi:phosphoglucosamine mutase